MFSASSIRFHLLLSTAVAASLTLPGKANAQTIPQGGVFVARGRDHPRRYGTNDRHHHSQHCRSVINWNSFDIGQNHTVDFTGPNAVAVLNRVVTIDVSDINGKLMSDPSIEVFLINPNGIIFGPHSSVDVGSFIASTLDLDDDDFMAGGTADPELGNRTLFQLRRRRGWGGKHRRHRRGRRKRHDRFGSADPIGRVRPRPRNRGRGHGCWTRRRQLHRGSG